MRPGMPYRQDSQLKAAEAVPPGAASVGLLEPVRLCHAVNDYYQTGMYDAEGIPHDNFARCDATHNHKFGCQLEHHWAAMPGVWVVLYVWMCCGFWLAVNHKTQKG